MLRCEVCRSTVSTRHPFDVVRCACGALVVRGRPWRPRVEWLVVTGGGWSDVTEDAVTDGDAEDAAASDGAAEDDDGDAPARRIGFRPRP